MGQKGIYPDPKSKVICRFAYEDVLIDVMSTREIGWAPSDPWFDPGFKNLVPYEVDAETVIRIFPVAYFLATKFSAFADRGGDPRTSKDFEDIVYVLDSRLNIVDEIREAPADLREFLRAKLAKFLDEDMNEAISSHLSRFSEEDRMVMLKVKIQTILK